MKIEHFMEILSLDFFAGVPDSQLRPLCDYLMDQYGISDHHMIAANEGNAVGLAAGYHLATGKIPAVYLQNSGMGNILNPVASLLNDKVYGIPCVFIVGWRGEPGVPDEPQHIYQGAVTLPLLEDMGVSAFVLGKDTTEDECAAKMKAFRDILMAGGQTAFVIRKDALEYTKRPIYTNRYTISREDAICRITAASGQDVIVSTTGKTSRELFEIREKNKQSHAGDFLTVGSMGHCSSIALGIALQRPQQKIWILDGDGAVLMHMGSMALLGANAPKNIVHIVLNNGAHESVGGMPTVADQIDLVQIARGCGYRQAFSVDTQDKLDEALAFIEAAQELSFIEVRCAVGSRSNLGRPTISVKENKREIMRTLIRL